MGASKALAASAVAAGALGAVWSVAAAGAQGGSSYEVRDVTPVGARTVWALTSGNRLHGAPQAVVRSGDGGARWSNVTPPGLRRAGRVSAISDLDVLGTTRAWLAYGRYGGDATSRQPLLTTSDGGRSWARVGLAPGACQLQFVDPRDGWCVATNGATGNMFITVYRTTDGGRRWQVVARNTPPGQRTKPTQIPFACDKYVAFVSHSTGFVDSASCAGGAGYVYRSTDGGRTWRRTLSLPTPRGGSGGAELTRVVGDAHHEAVGVSVVGYRRTPTSTVIFTSHDGGLRWSTVRPPVADRLYDVDLLSPRVWRLAAGRELLSTGDGGRTWERVSSDANLTRFGGLWFTTPSAGWDLDPTGGAIVLHTSDGGRRWNPVRVPER